MENTTSATYFAGVILEIHLLQVTDCQQNGWLQKLNPTCSSKQNVKKQNVFFGNKETWLHNKPFHKRMDSTAECVTVQLRVLQLMT
jgi:hypothetical protein